MRSQVSPRTLERYEDLAHKNIVPFIGATALTKLRPEGIAAAYAKALATGRRDGKGGLSPRTVHHMHRILKQALEHAVRWRILARNPADAVDPPKVERKKMSALDAAQTAALLAHFRETCMFVPVLLGVLLGLRRGEVTASRWSNLDGAMLAVAESTERTRKGTRAKETKSGRNRAVALPSLAVRSCAGIGRARPRSCYGSASASPAIPTSMRRQTARPSSRTASRTNSRASSHWRRGCHGSGSTIFGTATRRTCS
jgi:integrase